MLQEAKPFFDGLEQKKLMLQRCTTCNEVTFYPRHYCPNDLGELNYEEIEGKGKILSYSIVHRCAEPTLQSKLPYVAALIQLQDKVKMFARLIDIPLPLQQPIFNKDVEAQYEMQGEEQIIVFKIV